jgi:hypothetical protein
MTSSNVARLSVRQIGRVGAFEDTIYVVGNEGRSLRSQAFIMPVCVSSLLGLFGSPTTALVLERVALALHAAHSRMVEQ